MDEHVFRPIEVTLPSWGVCVLESSHAPGFLSPVLQHDFHKFILVVEGQGSLESHGQKVPAGQGTLIHVPAYTPHCLHDEHSHPVSLYAVCYRSSAVSTNLSKQLSQFGILHWRLDDYSLPLTNTLRSYFREMLFEQGTQRPGWETILCSRIGDMLVRAIRLQEGASQAKTVSFDVGNDSAARVALYAVRLKTQFYISNTLDEAAHATTLSRRRFTELFRQVTGQSWHIYVQQLRLNHARQLLRETDKSIAAIIFESGFDDVSHFYRVFKHVFGVSPHAYRKDHRLE